jgi:hypothetical protein
MSTYLFALAGIINYMIIIAIISCFNCKLGKMARDDL